MKTAGRENPNRWVTVPSSRVHGADVQNRSRSIRWAGKQEKLRPREMCFFLTSSFIELHRWDEKAGLRRDAIRSQWSTRSKRNRKETGYEKDYHWAGMPERYLRGAKADDRFGSGRSLVVLLCFG